MTGDRLNQAHISRALLALLFAVAFLANGGLGLWVSLTARPSHVNGLSAVVVVFGLIALAAMVQQLSHLSSHAKRGRGTARSGLEGAVPGAVVLREPPLSTSPTPPPLRRGGDIAPAPAILEHR